MIFKEDYNDIGGGEGRGTCLRYVYRIYIEQFNAPIIIITQPNNQRSHLFIFSYCHCH